MNITIVTPQFHRPRGEPGPASPPASRQEWEALRSMSRAALVEMGLRPWCDPADDDWPHDHVLMLLPGEWYQHIPDGYAVVGLYGEADVFARGISDDDIRFGCLPYGILVAPGGGA